MPNVLLSLEYRLTFDKICRECHQNQTVEGYPQYFFPQCTAAADGRLKYIAVPEEILALLREREIPFELVNY